MGSTNCLLITGSKVGEGKFSLSSDMYEPEKGSLENAGLVGVAGISSERSDAVVETLIGVLILGEYARMGVIGSGANGWREKRPPWR